MQWNWINSRYDVQNDEKNVLMCRWLLLKKKYVTLNFKICN